MNITEYADVINVNIHLTYHHNQDSRWSASFEDTEILNRVGCLQIQDHGAGPSPEAALQNYIDLITGKFIVIDVMNKEQRREFKAPMSIEI